MMGPNVQIIRSCSKSRISNAPFFPSKYPMKGITVMRDQIQDKLTRTPVGVAAAIVKSESGKAPGKQKGKTGGKVKDFK